MAACQEEIWNLPLCRLSSLLNPFEPGLLEEFIRSEQHEREQILPIRLDLLQDLLLGDLRDVLGPHTTLLIQGSFKKRTFWTNSDIDMIVDTGEDTEITREQQEEICHRLKEKPHFSLVGLGRKSIHFTFMSIDVDLVFSNLRGEGKLPFASEEVVRDDIVQLASVALKISVNRLQSRRVANFLLENLAATLHRQHQAKNGLELFLDAAQILVDTKGEVLNFVGFPPSENQPKDKKRLSAATLESAFNRLSSTLHLFCVSRFFLEGPRGRKGFSEVFQMEQWLQQIEGTGVVGYSIPGWIFGVPNPECAPLSSGKATQIPLSQEEISRRCRNVASSRSFQIFSASPSGKYMRDVGITAKTKESETFFEMNELMKYWLMGSQVAGRMVQVREMWIRGEIEYFRNNFTDAIEIWAEAIHLSKADGDPFSGRFLSIQENILREAVNKDPKNPNCAVVLGAWLFSHHRWRDAQDLVEDALKYSPKHKGLLHELSLILGNQTNADWMRIGLIMSSLIKMDPDEPINYYWKAVALRNTPGQSGWKEAVLMYEKFLGLASPEGRKYPIALKDLALYRLGSFSSFGSPEANCERFLTEYERGIEAENKVLPFLRKGIPDHEGDQMYRLVKLKDEKASISSLSNVLSDKRREKGNQFFQQGLYLEAIDCYSNALRDDPNDYRSLSNRSLCYVKLDRFVLATQDAENLIKVNPGWVKSYLRLAHANLKRKEASKAVQVCREGLSLFSDSPELVDMEKEARILLEQCPRKQINPKSLPCFSAVQYKDNCKVIDPKGKGDFLSLVDALDSSSLQQDPVSFILVGPSCSANPLSIRSSKVQIIGHQQRNDVKGGRGKKKRGGKKRPLIKCEMVDGILFKVEGKEAELHLEQLEMQAKSHCVSVNEGAVAKVTHCSAQSTEYASFCADNNSEMVIEQCFVPPRSHGAVVTERSKVTILNSRFEQTENICVVVRKGSSCSLKSCKIIKSKSQGVGITLGGKEVVMEKCEISQCGQPPQKSGILVESGVMKLIDCFIQKNKAEGIVVQRGPQTGSEGHLEMKGCNVTENGTSGVSVYQGSATISNSIIKKNRLDLFFMDPSQRQSIVQDCKITCIKAHAKVTFKDNIVDEPIITRDDNFELSSSKGLFRESSLNPCLFNQISPQSFDKVCLWNQQLKTILLDPSTKIQEKMDRFRKVQIPPRTTVDQQLKPTTIKQAWKKTDVRSEGKVLIGYTNTPVVVSFSVMVAMVDQEGSGVFVALYNFPGLDKNMTNQDVQSLLPVGSKLTLKEPFLRQFASGQIGIRVNNSSDFEVDTSTSCSRCGFCLTEMKVLKTCSACGRIFYCSRDCQREDWKMHKHFCFKKET